MSAVGGSTVPARHELGILGVLAVALVVPARAQTPTGDISGVVVDPSGSAVPGVTITLTSAATNAVREVVTNSAGLYVIPALPPGTLHAEGPDRRLPGDGAPGHRGAGRQLQPHPDHAGRRPPDRDGRESRRRAADPDQQRLDRHGHREPQHRRAAAQRPQLPAAGVVDSRRHDQRPLVQPGPAAHGRPAQQLRAQRRRPAHALQPLLARRHREHRPELQQLHAAAVGRRAAGVQGRGGALRRRVRPRHRADQRLDQVRHEPVSRHASSSSCATRRSTPRTTSTGTTGRFRRSRGTSTGSRSTARWSCPSSSTARTSCSSCSTGRACASTSR